MIIIGTLFMLRMILRKMLPPGMDWREISLGMLSMMATMAWQRNRRRLFIITLAIVGVYVARKSAAKAQLAYRRRQRRNQRDLIIEKLQQVELFTWKKDEITHMPLEELMAALRTNKLSAEDVLDAYLMKATDAHKKTNCLVDVLHGAKDLAKEADMSGYNKDKLLFGLPVSLKENVATVGTECTVGCAQLIGKPYCEDSVLVKVLRHHGAIPFVKTNVPQTMISWETSNPIYGATVNPVDPSRGCGGSSGGEAALIASDGSILGFGTDIGGSIRIPCHLCGLCGLKPTANRVSSKGLKSVCPGQTCIPACVGPIGRDVDTLVLAMRAILDPLMYRLDNTIPVMPFREEMYTKEGKLTIGYYTYDGFTHAVPACTRAVDEVVETLKSNGHTIVKWDFTKYGKRATLNWSRIIMADGGKHLLDIMKNDSSDSSMSTLRRLMSLPDNIINALSLVAKVYYPNSSVSLAVRNFKGVRSVSGFYKAVEDIMILREEVMSDWKQLGLDAVICPGFACPALKFGVAGKTAGAVSYTSAYNTLNFTAGALPVTKVTPQDVAKMNKYPVIDHWHSFIKQSMKGSEGLPIGIQVVTLPWQEELCLRVMKEVETLLKNNSQS